MLTEVLEKVNELHVVCVGTVNIELSVAQGNELHAAAKFILIDVTQFWLLLVGSDEHTHITTKCGSYCIYSSTLVPLAFEGTNAVWGMTELWTLHCIHKFNEYIMYSYEKKFVFVAVLAECR